jgi:hypothetical protein
LEAVAGQCGSSGGADRAGLKYGIGMHEE